MSAPQAAVAVVTGGAAGIGRALAVEASRQGALVMVGDVDDCSGTVAAIRSAGGVSSWRKCDVGIREDIIRLRDAAVAEFGPVNIVCSNVGIGARGALHEVSDEDFERTVTVNVTGSYRVLQVFAPDLIAAAAAGSSAQLLFTGSEHSLGVPPTDEPPYVAQASVYTMSKYALLGIAAVTRRDLRGLGVQVSILCPGWTATERLRERAASDAHTRMVLNTMGQDPAMVATLAFDGLNNGQHVIVTNPSSRDFVVAAHREIIAAAEAATVVSSKHPETSRIEMDARASRET